MRSSSRSVRPGRASIHDLSSSASTPQKNTTGLSCPLHEKAVVTRR